MVELKPSARARLRNRQRVLGIGDASADDGVDVDVEVGVLGEHAQLGVEDLERLLRDVVGHDVVDGNLHVIEAGGVEAGDAVGHQQVAVGDHAGDGAGLADLADDVVELGVQQRLATGDGDDGGAEAAEMVDAAAHFVDVDGVGDVVELVAVGAGEVAAAHGHDVRHVRMRGAAPPPERWTQARAAYVSPLCGVGREASAASPARWKFQKPYPAIISFCGVISRRNGRHDAERRPPGNGM